MPIDVRSEFFLCFQKKGAQIDLNLLLGLRRNVSRSSLSYFERAHQPEYERLVLTNFFLEILYVELNLKRK